MPVGPDQPTVSRPRNRLLVRRGLGRLIVVATIAGEIAIPLVLVSQPRRLPYFDWLWWWLALGVALPAVALLVWHAANWVVAGFAGGDAGADQRKSLLESVWSRLRPWTKARPRRTAEQRLGTLIFGLAGALVGLISVGLWLSPTLRPASFDDFSELVAVGPRPVAPATCSKPPTNGQVLRRGLALLPAGGHAVDINNGSGGAAIVKLKDPQDGQRTRLSFFVAKGATTTVAGIPDGDYLVEFAFGDALDSACANFIATRGAQRFPTIEKLRTERLSSKIVVAHLSYTLYAVPSGNVRTASIDVATFLSD